MIWFSLVDDNTYPESLIRCSLISVGRFAARHSKTTLSSEAVLIPVMVVVMVLSVIPVLRDNSAWDMCFHLSALCHESARSLESERYILASSKICSNEISLFIILPFRSNGEDREHVRSLDNGAKKRRPTNLQTIQRKVLSWRLARRRCQDRL